MLNKNRVIQLSVMLLVLLLLFTWRTLTSVADETKQTQILDSETVRVDLVRCDYLTPCIFISEQGTFGLTVNNPPIKAEQWINFSLQSDVDNWQVVDAKIVGKSMFMGRIPVTFKASDEHAFTAQTLVGACTTKNMIWQLQIIVQVNDRQALLTFDFLVEK